MNIHGGDVYRNYVDIDFSINVNPLGTPECVKEALHRAVEMCGKYPDMEAERLGAAVSTFLGVPKEYLLFGNGASELFMAIVHGIKPKKVVIPVPSFYGYEYAAKSVDSDIIYYEMKQENNFCLKEEMKRILTDDVNLLFLANPNNPIGNPRTTIPQDQPESVILDYAYKALDDCEAIVFSTFSGMIGHGVFNEIIYAFNAGKKVYQLDGTECIEIRSYTDFIEHGIRDFIFRGDNRMYAVVNSPCW